MIFNINITHIKVSKDDHKEEERQKSKQTVQI